MSLVVARTALATTLAEEPALIGNGSRLTARRPVIRVAGGRRRPELQLVLLGSSFELAGRELVVDPSFTTRKMPKPATLGSEELSGYGLRRRRLSQVDLSRVD